MSGELCPGCGRAVAGDMVSCPGCSRSLRGGGAVPPGWEVTTSATTTIPGAPRWRLAGIDTARPPEAAEATIPRASTELFRPRPEDTLDMEPTPAPRTGWKVRDRQPRELDWTPAAATAATSSMARTARRIVYWALVGGILATSSAAVLLLTLHMARGR